MPDTGTGKLRIKRLRLPAGLGAGGWRGAASEAFVSSAERVIHAFSSDADACAKAAGALEQLSHALQHAQQVTRQALADAGVHTLATIYHALGIRPDAEVHDREGRPQRICDGRPVTAIF